MLGLNLFPAELACSTKVLFTNLGEQEQEASMRIISKLRDKGVAAEIYPDMGKMKKQMEYANRRGIPYVVIIGSNELERKVATIKDMRSGEQREVSFEELVAAF
jgi:histidyl-tRNA synthetase